MQSWREHLPSEKNPKKPKAKSEPKPKLTDEERHKRFVDMAHEVETDERPEVFDKAFDKVVKPRSGKD
jgi:hypothetical protein